MREKSGNGARSRRFRKLTLVNSSISARWSLIILGCLCSKCSVNFGILYISTWSLKPNLSSRLGHGQVGSLRRGIGFAHSSASWDIAIELSLVKTLDRVFLLFLEREIVKVAADSKLAVDALLGDVEILDVEEALLANGSNQGPCEFRLSFRGVAQGKIDCDQVGPVKIGLWLNVEVSEHIVTST